MLTRLKQLLVLALALAAGVAAAQPVISTQNLNATGDCTPNSCVLIDMRTSGSASVQIPSTAVWTATGGLTLQRSNNRVQWETVSANAFIPVGGTGTASITSAATGTWQLGGCVGLRWCRVIAQGTVTGSATIDPYTANAPAGGNTSISGGAGDASASNQVTGNNSLSSIDTKTPALSSGRVPVEATQSGTWPVRNQDGAGNALTSATRGSERALSVQIVDGSGAQVTSFGGGGAGLAQGSTTSGQTGGLNMGAVTTAAPSYTTGTTQPISITPAGEIRVAVTGGGGTNVSGSTAHDGAGAAVNPVATGGFASAAAPTDVSADVDIVRAWHLRNGAAAVNQTFAGVLAATGSGTTNTGTQRVVHATDDPLITAVNATNTQLPAALGQTTMAASMSVAIASNQSNIPVNNAQINGVTPLMGAGNTGTGSQRVTLATDQAALPAHGHGAANAAAPAGAQMQGVRSGTTMVAQSQPNTTAAISVSTATTTQLVALAASSVIHVGSYSLISAGTGNARFVYGTGTNCGTGTTNLTGDYPLVANAGISLGAGVGPVLAVPAGNALCVTTSAAVAIGGHVTFTQYVP